MQTYTSRGIDGHRKIQFYREICIETKVYLQLHKKKNFLFFAFDTVVVQQFDKCKLLHVY